MTKRQSVISGIFITLSLINIVLMLLWGTSFLLYALFGLLLLGYLGKYLDREEFLIYVLFVPNKYLQLLAIPILLFMEGKLLKGRLEKKTTLFMIYIFAISVVNCIIYDGFFGASLFQIGLYYCVFRLIEILKESFDNEIVYRIFDRMFWLQCLAVAIEFLILRATMDVFTGTLISAHYLGVFLLIYIYILLKRQMFFLSKLQKLTRLLVGLVVLILADAKHVWMLFFLALICSKILELFKVKKKIAFSILLMTFGIAFVLILTEVPSVKALIQKNEYIQTYVYNSDYNKKYEFFNNTLKEMKSWQGLFGFGVGQFGSQICLTMSKGIIYSWNPLLEKYHYAIAPYVNAISGVMTEWYVENGIVISSMVMGYPLVSYVGFVGELGLIGIFMFLRLLDRNFLGGNRAFIIFFFMISLFDTYYEIPCVFVMLLIAANLRFKQKSNLLEG